MLYDKDQFDNAVMTYRILEDEYTDAQRYKHVSGIINFNFYSFSGLITLLALCMGTYLVFTLLREVILVDYQILIFGEILLIAIFIWRRFKRYKMKKNVKDAYLKEMRDISQRSMQRQQWLKTSSIVPACNQQDLGRLSIFISYMEEGRAQSLTQAINLYYRELREMEREQRRYEEERRYNNERLRVEREKISAIDDLKYEQDRTNNELEYQSRVIRFGYK